MSGEIIDPEGLKGGPGRQAQLVQEYLGRYRVHGDNPPMVVAENGEAMLSMMWPVHEQTPEGEQAAVEYTTGLAAKIAELLNQSPDLTAANATIAELRAELAAQNANRDAWREDYSKAAQDRDDYKRFYEQQAKEHHEANAKIYDLGLDLERISEAFPDDAPHKHEQTGCSLLDDVRDALRDLATARQALETERAALRGELAEAKRLLGEALKQSESQRLALENWKTSCGKNYDALVDLRANYASLLTCTQGLAEALQRLQLIVEMASDHESLRCPACKTAWSITEVDSMLRRQSGSCMCGRWKFDTEAALSAFESATKKETEPTN